MSKGEPVAMNLVWDAAEGGAWQGSGLTMPPSLAAHGEVAKAVLNSAVEKASNTPLLYGAFFGVLPKHDPRLCALFGSSCMIMAREIGFDQMFLYTGLPTLQGRSDSDAALRDHEDQKTWWLKFEEVSTHDEAVLAELRALDGVSRVQLARLNYMTSPPYVSALARTMRGKLEDVWVPSHEMAYKQLGRQPMIPCIRFVNVDASYVSVGGLKVHPILAKLVEDKICPGSGFSPAYFWSCLGSLVAELEPEVDNCLKRRDTLQAKIDGFYQQRMKAGDDIANPKFRPVCHKFLREIGYLVPDGGPAAVMTQNTDAEVAEVAGPQLVCPADNPRFLLNAVNSRWGSLFDALYGFDVIAETAQTKKSGPYNPVRGEAVIEFANGLLDEVAPLVSGKWADVVRVWPKVVGDVRQLELELKSGGATSLQTPSLFVGSSGSCENGRVFLKHNGLHMILEIDRQHSIGATNPSGMKDITMEAGVTTIMDMEDSVSAVDAEDKAKVYETVNGVFRGILSASMTKDGQPFTRTMNADISLRNERNIAVSLHGRSLCLVRNVGHHMYTDAVLTEGGKKIPEGFLDCMITVVSALHDLNGTSQVINSRKGSIYIVKPKMHGPEEVLLTTRIFGRAEEFFGLARNTIKVGIMDEERRTSANLKECVRVAAERVFFINTGFLDRTGDEIHTCMFAGPVVRKSEMKQQPWIKAYEASNVDIGLYSGFQGKAQIGKGMWAKPDMMKDMLAAKINELNAGASTAWVPSPTGAVLHAVHYHQIHVPGRQMQLAMRDPTPVEDILNPPLLQKPLTPEEITLELRETAQSVLGYVVRWIDLGVGCSKVPDFSDVGLMEDRATLRISSQLISNWLHHGLITKDQTIAAFKEMAVVVDRQNASDKAYTPMAPHFDGKAFEAALKLCFDGMSVPNGYTEYTLHDFRQQVKAGGAKTALLAKL